MKKEKRVVDFYVLCNRLKDVIRTGWIDFNVKKGKAESVAEHTYGVQMLAIAMYIEYKYVIDIKKVIYMIAIHDIGEALIGDLTDFNISKEAKEEKEHDAVHIILSKMLDAKKVEKLFIEFDEGKSPEAIFARNCDKLECDIQAKIYDEAELVGSQRYNKTLTDQEKDNIKKGKPWYKIFFKADRKIYKIDKNFLSVSKFVENNDIL